MDMEIGSMQTGWDASLQGYRKAEESMAGHAKDIAQATTEAASDAPPSPKTPDLATAMVGLKTSELSGGYNMKAMKVQDNMAKELMNLFG